MDRPPAGQLGKDLRAEAQSGVAKLRDTRGRAVTLHSSVTSGERRQSERALVSGMLGSRTASCHEIKELRRPLSGLLLGQKSRKAAQKENSCLPCSRQNWLAKVDRD